MHEATSDETEEKQDEDVIIVMAKQEFDQELVRVARTIKVKPLPKTSILVAMDANDIVQVDAFKLFEQYYSCKASRGVTEVYSRRPFYIIIADASKTVIKLA